LNSSNQGYPAIKILAEYFIQGALATMYQQGKSKEIKNKKFNGYGR
jgi:hypothetical protein